MNKKLKIAAIFLLVAGLILTACNAQPEVEEEPVQDEAMTLFVGPELVDCEGEGPQKCMLVKESPEQEYQLFYDQIEGFNFEEGFEYELLVRQENVENPPAGGSSIRWILVDEVSKVPAETAEAPVEETDSELPADLPPEGEIITMYVGPEIVDCVGAAPQTCMQVKLSPDAEYTLFYDQIDGFEHEPGFEYELSVLVEPVENPPADASNLRYTLIEEVNKIPVETEEQTPPTASLEGTTWSLFSYIAPNGEEKEILPESRITAEFNEGQVAGTAGCNNYFGSYELDGNSLTFGPTGSTMMFCAPEELMLQETAYLAVLGTTSSYEIVDGQLHLKNEAGDTVLIFNQEDPISLIGTMWEVVSYNNGNQGVVSILGDTRMTAVFGEDGILSGNAGCNSYSAGFEVEGENIVIGPAASTEMFCAEPEGLMDQETLYLAAIQNAATYRIDGDRLELRDAEGALQASYQAAESTALPGTAWRLLFHNNGQEAMVSTIIGTEITALFSEDGQISGSSGCNDYTGSYETEDDAITIGPLALTRKLCSDPEGIMEQEAQYIAALQNAATFKIDGDQLDIRDADGSGVASYMAMEVEDMETSTTESSGDKSVESNTEAAETPSSEAIPEDSLAAAANASYPLEYSSTGIAQLTGGEFREAADDDSASEVVVQLSDQMAMDELSNGRQGLAVILISQTGGTGTFYDLAVLSDENGQLAPAAVTYLGDRIIINDIAIQDGQIVLDMVIQGQDDPFCCPTQQVIQTYELQEDELVQVASVVVGTVEPQSEELPQITEIIWKWQRMVTPVEEIIIDEPDKYTFELQPDGQQINVVSDCNTGAGEYEIDGSSISINITSTTLALCEEGSHSDLFFRSLNEAAIYFTENDMLLIDLPADGGTLSFSSS